MHLTNLKKSIPWMILLVCFGFGCGQGTVHLGHVGICDGYPDWEDSEYILPWAAGDEYEVSQGNCSGASHYGVQRYAYDFIMDIGTDVLASRAGTVIEIKESYKDSDGCPKNNFVRIQHSDGTVAQYTHLTKNGALVEVGDTVNQGDVIAQSGNSGCSTDPHLHFVVYVDDDLQDTVPVTFSNTRENRRGLIRGKTYQAE